MEKKKGVFVLSTLNTADIRCDKYQRPVDVSAVRKIVAHWDDSLANFPKVSYRDGKYYVFDGQHTISAHKLRNNGKDVDIICKVYHGLTYEDEARLFAEQNGISKNVSADQKLKALYEAKDPDVLDVVGIIEGFGYVNPIVSKSRKNRVKSVTTALNIYKKHGRKRLCDIFDVITGAWGTDTDACKSGIISGLNIVFSRFPGEFKKADLVSSLKKASPLKIDADAKADFVHTGTKAHAFQIVRYYNVRRRTRLDEREIR